MAAKTAKTTILNARIIFIDQDGRSHFKSVPFLIDGDISHFYKLIPQILPQFAGSSQLHSGQGYRAALTYDELEVLSRAGNQGLKDAFNMLCADIIAGKMLFNTNPVIAFE